MRYFKKILVGVDLSGGDRFVANDLSPPNAEAVRQAVWLAKINDASIDFLFALDVSAKAREMIEASGANESTVIRQANERVAVLAESARSEGVEAGFDVVVGKSWASLVNRVLLHGHDLVLAGSRHTGAMQGWFLGGTTSKLLRTCPCPVWVTKPRPREDSTAILVAHDLMPVGDVAMELGRSMAELQGAELHVVHSAEYPELEYFRAAGVSPAREEAYLKEAEAHIRSHFDDSDDTHGPQLHLVSEAPADAILQAIEQYNINLLVMGTSSRVHGDASSGLAGKTAERVLPRLPCSLLAFKPPGFKCPVTLVSN